MSYWKDGNKVRLYIDVNKVRDIYENQGTSAAKFYVRKILRWKITADELRELLGVHKQDIRLSQEAHRLAWGTCGWGGTYSPIGYNPADAKAPRPAHPEGPPEPENQDEHQSGQIMVNEKMTRLLAAGLITRGQRLLISG